jgi:hypothetical protein
MGIRGWVVLQDGDGRYRADVLEHLPGHGQEVRFEAMGRLLHGTFHTRDGVGYFRATKVQDILFLVVAGGRCEVERWTAVPARRKGKRGGGTVSLFT